MRVNKNIKDYVVYNKIKNLEIRIMVWLGYVFFVFCIGIFLFLVFNGFLLFAGVFILFFLFFWIFKKTKFLSYRIILFYEKKRIEKFKNVIEKKFNIKIEEIAYDFDFGLITLRITDNKLYRSDIFLDFVSNYQIQNRIDDMVVICNTIKINLEDQIEI